MKANFTAPLPYGLVAAGLAAVALIGALLLFDDSRGFGVPGDPSAPSPSAAGTVTATPARQSAVDFVHPFTYVIDPSSGIELPAYDATTYNFRVPARPPGEGWDEGVIVHTGGDGLRTDVCSPTGGAVNEDPTPQEVIDVITSLEGIQVSAPEQTTVDGSPALAVTVGGDENRRCDYHVFENLEPPFASVDSEGRTRRIILTEVDGDLVVIAITASDGAWDPWLPTAEAFIESIDFGE